MSKNKQKSDSSDWDFERPKDALVDLKLEGKVISTDKIKAYKEKTIILWKLNTLTDAELLAWTVELLSRVEKRLEHLQEACVDCDNKGTEDEDNYVFNEQKYNAEKLKINEKAKELLDINFNFRFFPEEDLFERVGVELPK